MAPFKVGSRVTFVRTSHYLQDHNCQGGGENSLVGEGSELIVVDKAVAKTDFYDEHIKVRVVSNTSIERMRATPGCEGWAPINDIVEMR